MTFVTRSVQGRASGRRLRVPCHEIGVGATPTGWAISPQAPLEAQAVGGRWSSRGAVYSVSSGRGFRREGMAGKLSTQIADRISAGCFARSSATLPLLA